MSEKFLARITLIRSSLGSFIPINSALSTLDFKSGILYLKELIGFSEVIKIENDDNIDGELSKMFSEHDESQISEDINKNSNNINLKVSRTVGPVDV